MRGFEFRPGHRAVHHANIRVDPTPASRRLDEADPAPGYEGAILHSADYPDGHFLGWTPGQAPPLASPDLAWRLDAGDDLVVQLHLQPTGKLEAIRPSIGLYFTDAAPAHTPVILRLGRQNLDIPAGAGDYRVVDSYVLPVDAEVRAIQPHAHYRAREVSAWAILPDGARRPLIRIRNWDFNWQDQYRYAAPFWVPAGTRIEMEYVFDNSDANPRNPDHPPERVSWGWRSSDEMADVWIQVMTRSDADRVRLTGDVRRKMAAEDAVGCETLIARQPDYVDLRNDAASLYLELGQPRDALRHFEAVARLQPQSAPAHYNVGVALEAAGRTRRGRTRIRSGAAARSERTRSRTTISAACAWPRGGSTKRAGTTSGRWNRAPPTPKRATTWARFFSPRATRARSSTCSRRSACVRRIRKRISISPVPTRRPAVSSRRPRRGQSPRHRPSPRGRLN